jgi:hypothetical protein
MFHFSKKSIEVNSEQYNAIVRPLDVNQRIIASAGSGKTTTITARIAYLIEYHNIKSNQIILLTFSRNSVIQMKKKLYDLIGENNVWTGTFHGLAKNLLQKYDPKSIQTLYFVDELIGMGEKWLQTYEGRKWVGKIRYIFVDEFQDINLSQWKMILRLHHIGSQLIVVGDDCQNIYTWRGSNVDFILNLEKTIKYLIDDQLHINYRSSENIIQVANSIMKHIPTLPWKHTMVPHQPKYMNPNVHFFYRFIDETNWIIKHIQKSLEINPNVSIAIMSRMNNDLYRFEEEFIIKNISYRLFDIGIEISENSTKNINSVDLVTIHSSKGLEWDIVYLVHMNDDIFPSNKKKEDIINERRLFYVAVTRARKELYFTYNNDERNLSRFIREIPNTLLTYHGLAKYMLSEFELGKSKKRLSDILGCLNTEDISILRQEKYLDWFSTDQLIVSSLYPADMYWKKPIWITNETLPDFQRFLNIWLKRHLSSLANISYRDPSSEKLIFTLRIFTEDFEFFNLWKDQITYLVNTCFGCIPKNTDIPNIDYKMLENWSKINNIEWTPKDIVNATSIMGKIRGQLRPLRFYTYDIKEFNIGTSRFVVPIQWRGEVLESWRKIVDKTISWKDCLVDIWKIGALKLVAEGRNVAMYRSSRIKEYLEDKEFIKFLECVEEHTSMWFSEKNIIGTSVYVENEYGIQDIFDLQTDSSLYNIGGIRFESSDLLRLAIGSTFLENYPDKIGIFIPLDGKLFTLKLPNNIKEISNHILSIALSKSN